MKLSTMRPRDGWWHRARAGAVLLVLAASAAFVPAAMAQSSLRGEPSDLTSDSERMISYRHQQHLWRTDDGALHLLVNRGTTVTDPGLSLYTSLDNGSTWLLAHDLPDTSDTDTGDMVLQGNLLSIVYPNINGEIVFDQLSYDSATTSWTLLTHEIAFSESGRLGVNPSLTIDAAGNVWAAFVHRVRSGAATDLRMVVRPAGGSWMSTGQIYGPTDNKSIERSARLVSTAGGVGMVYKVRNAMYWAMFDASQPLDSEWPSQLLLVGTPQRRLADPYASHFGARVDASDRVHISLVDDYNIWYLGGPADGSAWTQPLLLPTRGDIAYSQMALIGSRIIVAYGPSSPTAAKAGAVLESTDGGLSFSVINDLRPPKGVPNASYKTPRIELPVNAVAPLNILQQFEQEGGQRLLTYSVEIQ